MNSEHNDQELLKGLANSDKQAIESIYKQHFRLIQSLVVNNSGSSEDARDIFQEGMVVLYEKALDPVFTLNCQLKTYLYSVCRRLWLKRLQQMNRFPGLPETSTDLVTVDDDLAEHEARNEEMIRLEHAVNSLGEPCKSILEAYYFEKKNMEQIASDFGYTNAGNAKNQKYKCLMRLKKIFFAQLKKGAGDE